MGEKLFNVLFIRTGNSARSIFAERLINRLGRGKFRGYSAGNHPRSWMRSDRQRCRNPKQRGHKAIFESLSKNAMCQA